MSVGRNDEKVINGQLAIALEARHPRWSVSAEQSHTLRGNRASKPDIVIKPIGGRAGVPVVIETEWDPASTVDDDATKRIGRSLAGATDVVNQVVAVALPTDLRDIPTAEVPDLLEEVQFKYRLLSATPAMRAASTRPRTANALERFPTDGWITGVLDDLAGFCERIALSEHLIDEAAAALESAVTAATGELRTALEQSRRTVLEKIAAKLHQDDTWQTTVMGVTMVANALLFQTAIANTMDAEGYVIPNPDPTDNKHTVIGTWERILEINYWPIFATARNVLREIPDAEANSLLNYLTNEMSLLAGFGVSSTGDMAGQMLGKLITDRKFLATFYTLPASAHLLAELAVARIGVDWSDAEQVAHTRIADLACGTGTLLTAAYQRVMARVRRTASVNDQNLHTTMMERALIGADIMPAAVHLTATLLSSLNPTIPFAATRVFLMPFGDDPDHGISIGSLELLATEFATTLWSSHTAVSGEQEKQDPDYRPVLDHDEADLIIMNPPFTRDTAHEAEAAGVPMPSFAGFNTPDDEQDAMKVRLKHLRKRLRDIAGHGNVGRAADFIDVAHAKTKPRGTIALVLPFTMMRGGGWEATRGLLAKHYEEMTVVSIADTGSQDRAFSADTGMAEVLFIARKRPNDHSWTEPDRGQTVLFVNLHRRPSNLIDGVEVARSIIKVEDHSRNNRPAPPRAGALHVGDATVGNFIRARFDDTGAAAVTEPNLVACATALSQGEVWLPRLNEVPGLHLTTLSEIGQRGPVDRDINGWHKDRPRGPFDKVRRRRQDDWKHFEYPLLWRHDVKTGRESNLIVEPDSQGRVRDGCQDRAREIWDTASRLHFNRDFQLNSQPLAACLTEAPCIGGRAWPSFSPADDQWEHLLLLWANSTLGLVSWWWTGTRQQRGRAVITVKRLPELPVLDPRTVTHRQLALARDLVHEFADREFRPAHKAYDDPLRKELDHRLLVDTLGCSPEVTASVDVVRHQWCHQPSVYGTPKQDPSSST